MTIAPSNFLRSSDSSLSRTLQVNLTPFNCSLASNLPPDNYCEDDQLQIPFPLYNDISGSPQAEELGSHHTDNSRELSSTFGGASINASRQYSLGLVKRADDDTTLCTQPSIHVDYLLHNWKEEDVRSSWKYIVSKRWKYSNSVRLENASWRAWMKLKNKLKTISPEALKWQKDCDMTWLYGPLQTGSNEVSWMANISPYESSRASTSNSSLHKKSILKKRTLSETILQSSILTSLLLRQDAAGIQVQQFEERSDGPPTRAAASDDVGFPFSLRQMYSGMLPSAPSSSPATLSAHEEKRIQFNEQVQQCIAADVEEGSEEGIDPYAVNHNHFDSDSDDSGIMMKPINSKGKFPAIFSKKTTSGDGVDGKTIMMLPTTILNSREDVQRTPTGMLTTYEDDEG